MPEYTAEQGTIDKNARIWGMLCHLSALLGILGIPFGNLIGPLLVWLFKKTSSPFVDQQGREALNFQLSMTVYALGAALLFLLKMGMFFLLIIAGINFILVVIASLRAYNGETYRYPFTIHFIKK